MDDKLRKMRGSGVIPKRGESLAIQTMRAARRLSSKTFFQLWIRDCGMRIEEPKPRLHFNRQSEIRILQSFDPLVRDTGFDFNRNLFDELRARFAHRALHDFHCRVRFIGINFDDDFIMHDVDDAR